jgi:hypothetical protein
MLGYYLDWAITADLVEMYFIDRVMWCPIYFSCYCTTISPKITCGQINNLTKKMFYRFIYLTMGMAYMINSLQKFLYWLMVTFYDTMLDAIFIC